MTAPVRFATIEAFGTFTPETFAADVVEIERLGFDAVGLADHLHSERPNFEPWTAITWAAALTTRITVLTNVLGAPYRAPAVTAKMAETLDRLSGGRLVLGLGSGGYEPEFTAFGFGTRTPGQRVTALRETIEIIRGVWSGRPFSYTGRHHQVDGARIAPAPAHPIPIWLGSYGPRALKLTGSLADGWLPSLGRLEWDQARAMRDAVRAAARDAGRDPDAITCATNLGLVTFDATRTPTTRSVAGSVEAVAEQVAEIARAGFTFLNVAFPDAEQRERFAREVIPLVRAELR